MFCKWCGMESTTTDNCSWCHHALNQPGGTPGEEAQAEAEAEALHAEEGLAAGAAAPQLRLSTDPEPESAPVAASVPENAPETVSRRPIIGVKRPGAAAGGRPVAPAPVTPMMNRSTPPSAPNSAPATSRPVPIAPILPANRAPSAPSTDKVAAPVVARQPIPAPATPIAVNRAPIQAKPVETAEPEAEEFGLAAGLSAPNKHATPVAEANVPQLGTFEAEKSKYYAGQVIDPVSGTHYDSETGTPSPAPTAKKRPEDNVVLNWDEPKGFTGLPAFGVAMLVLVGIMWVVIAATKSVIIPVLIVNAIAGVLLPVLRVGPWQDDDGEDTLLFVISTLVLGAVPTLILYLVWSGLRSGGNASILGCAVVASVTRLVADFASVGLSTASVLPPWHAGFTLGMIIAAWGGIAAVIGWVGGNVFHKADE